MRPQLGKQRHYLYVFFAHNGPGPYVCWFCDTEVVFEEVCVHHLDEDRDNAAPENLKPCHDDCHKSHHVRTMLNHPFVAKWACLDCGLIANPGPMGNHQKSSGHAGKIKI